MTIQTCLTSTVKIQQFHTLGSTNECAKQWLKDGVAAPFWIVSDEQTGGRGRHGRDWVSLKGNLFASTAQKVAAKGIKLTTLSLVTAMAVHDAILKTSDDTPRLTLKWPNDILSGQAKLAGILIENQSDPNADDTNIVIGFGINIQSSPVISDKDTTCLRNINHHATRDEILNQLILSLDYWIKRWDNGNNFNEIRQSWLERAAPIGAPLTVKIGQEQLTGKFAGLDENGALKLELENKTIKLITGGEIL